MNNPLTEFQGEFLARLNVIRIAHREWETHSFGEQSPKLPLTGIVEELGELSRTNLKFQQNIRGVDEEKYMADGKDACADIGIYLVSFLNKLIPDEITVKELKLLHGDSHAAYFPLGLVRTDFNPRYAAGCDAYWSAYADLFNSVNTLFRAQRQHAEGAPSSIALLGLILPVFRMLSRVSLAGFNANFIDLLEGTWHGIVAKRDWKANPDGSQAASH